MAMKRPHGNRRLWLVLARWRSVIFYGVVAGTASLALEPFTSRLCAPLVTRLATLPPLQASVFLLVFACMAFRFVAHNRWRGFLGIRFFFTYPPLWVAIISGLAVWFGGTSWLHGSRRLLVIFDDVQWLQSLVPPFIRWCTLLVGLPLLLFATFLPEITAFRQSRRAAAGAHECDEARGGDFDALRRWLQDDSEVSEPDDDRFGHDEIARRMAGRLMQPDVAPTMALLGILGSGKSTIRQLVAYHLRNRPTVRLVDVSIWPFDSVEAAVRGILRAIVRELGRHVNVLPLAGLSDEYITAIEKTVGKYSGIVSLLRGSSDPQQIVQRLSDISQAAGLRLVLWIEDLERFSGGDQLEGDSRIEREVEQLGPIRALLHLLDRCPHISVVISDTSLRTRFDLGKIARFIEHPPGMDAERVWNVTALLRDRCLGGYPVAVADPALPKTRETLTLNKGTHAFHAWLSSFRDSQASIPLAIAQVLRTPRALKSSLRLAIETWEKLPGEIDFDAALVASVLRVTAPDLFALVDEHIGVFQRGLEDPFTVAGERKPHEVVKQIEKLLGCEDERSAVSFQALLSFLFPQYPPGRTNADAEYVARPQALFVNRHADYWRRYLAQIPVDKATCDQNALASIMAWREHEPSDLIDRIVDPRRSEQIEQFVGQFQPEDLCRLLSDVAERLTPESASGWDRRADASGIAAVWRMMLNKRPSERLVFETVSEIVKRTARVNLPLAQDLTYLFAESSPAVPTLMSDEQRHSVERTLQGTLGENFIGEGAENRLLRALNGGSPWVVVGAARRDQIPSGRGHIPFTGWREFANVLLNLAEAQPSIGVPVVVPFVTTSNMGVGHQQNRHGEPERVAEWVGRFDEKAARNLFDFDRLVGILARFDVPDDLDGQIKAHCHAAVEAAREIKRDTSEDKTGHHRDIADP